MISIDHRNETWEDVRARLTESRLEVYEAWKLHGPGTTRQIAEKSGIDILTFRPRSTDLLQLGYITLWDESDRGREGVYRARSEAEALSEFRTRQEAAKNDQLSLALN